MKFFHLNCRVVACLCLAALLAGCATPESIALQEGTEQGLRDMTFELDKDAHPGLLDPSKAKFEAPKQFKAKFKTTKGDFVIEVNRDWAPNGADRFYSMVKVGYFKNTAIFRAIDGFMFQFGVHGVPDVAAKWSKANFKDDPAGKSNIRGTISFAQTGMPNSRSSQMFINMGNNTFLDQARGGGSPFVPFGKIVDGGEVLTKINTSYGENPRTENIQGKFVEEGNAYIQKRFPGLDYILSVSIVEDEEGTEGDKSDNKDAGTPDEQPEKNTVGKTDAGGKGK